MSHGMSLTQTKTQRGHLHCYQLPIRQALVARYTHVQRDAPLHVSFLLGKPNRTTRTFIHTELQRTEARLARHIGLPCLSVPLQTTTTITGRCCLCPSASCIPV